MYFGFFPFFFTTPLKRINFQDAWKHRNHPNFKFLWFEDMIDNLPKAIQDISDFTNYKVPTFKYYMHKYLPNLKLIIANKINQWFFPDI